MKQRVSRQFNLSYYLRVWLAVISKSLSKSVAYRFELISKIIRTLLILATQLILIQAVFASSEYIDGWSLKDYYLLLGIYNVINYLGWGIFNVNLWRIEEKVLKGEFDFLLLAPTGSVFSASFLEFFLDDAIAALSGLVLIGFYLVNSLDSITAIGLFLGGVSVILGLIIWYALHLFVASFTFISPKNGLLDLLKSFSRMASFPTDIFSQNIRIVLYSLFPMAFIAAVPARIVNGIYSIEFVFGAGLIAFLSLGISFRVWNYSLKHYTGFGG